MTQFVAGRLIFGGSGTLVLNRAVVSEMEVEVVTYDVELPPVLEVELPEAAAVELPEVPEIEIT